MMESQAELQLPGAQTVEKQQQSSTELLTCTDSEYTDLQS